MKRLLFILALSIPFAAQAQTYLERSNWIVKDQYARQIEFHEFGQNDDVGASEEVIWSVGGAYTGWLLADSTVRISSGGSSDDTAAGDGCRQVTVSGLDGNWDAQTATIATNGASASTATTETFIRVNLAYCSVIGVFDGPLGGNITLETTAGTVLARVDSAEGQSRMGIYTVPRGYVLIVNQVNNSINTSNRADVEWYRRDNTLSSDGSITAPFGPNRIWYSQADVSGPHVINMNGGVVFDEYTDIWAAATRTTGSAAQVSVDITGWLFRK